TFITADDAARQICLVCKGTDFVETDIVQGALLDGGLRERCGSYPQVLHTTVFAETLHERYLSRCAVATQMKLTPPSLLFLLVTSKLMRVRFMALSVLLTLSVVLAYLPYTTLHSCPSWSLFHPRRCP
ncbi:unnamed protein product, partial [Ectocarpus sp. 4 AP-2014]